MKEILLYGGINNWSAADFIASMNDNAGQDITCRVNSMGGDVFSGWGMIAKMQEHDGKIKMKIDGCVASMTAFMTLFANDVECLDVSSFVFHRADGYTSTDEDKAWLASINANFRKKMEAKIPSALWAEITGKTYNDLFNPDTRIDVALTAKQAKKLGIVSKINTLSSSEAKAIKAEFTANYSRAEFGAQLPMSVTAALESNPIIPNNPIPKKYMTIAEFKTTHPELHAQIVSEAVATETDRVGSFMAFIDVDAVAVKAGIESGKPMTATQMSNFQMSFLKKQTLGTLPTEVTPTGEVIEDITPVGEKKVADFMAEAGKLAGLKNEVKTTVN
jgi:ATP-dependent protease ClpP protease subunit